MISLKYRDALGVLRRESSETEKEQEARRLLKQREGVAVEARVTDPRSPWLTCFRSSGRSALSKSRRLM
jgi:hypothetical protein